MGLVILDVQDIKMNTDTNDFCEVTLGGKTYRKGHPLVQYKAFLVLVQAHSAYLPKRFNNFLIREPFQESVFSLIKAIESREPRSQEVTVDELSQHMENQVEYISGGLKPLTIPLRSTESTIKLHILHGFCHSAETQCVAAADYIELSAKGLSKNLLYMLEKSAKMLSVLSSWVYAFAWVYSSTEDGSLQNECKWVPYTEEKIRKLNIEV